MLIPQVNASDHILGLPGPDSVVLVEYGSYDCARCHDSYYAVRDIHRFLGNHLTYVFRPLPTSADENSLAFRAAEAAEAAGSQGWFWEMHDQLFEHQVQLDAAHLSRYAEAIALDTARFKREMEERKHSRCVQRSIEYATMSRIEKIPAFFINDIRFNGHPDVDELLSTIEDVLIQHR
jgi:protein-disulfide isomerase